MSFTKRMPGGEAVRGHWKLCETTGKRSWPSKQQARAGSKTAGHRLRAYQCDHCYGWHVTKNTER